MLSSERPTSAKSAYYGGTAFQHVTVFLNMSCLVSPLKNEKDLRHVL